MSRRTTALVKAALTAMHATRVDGLMAPWARSQGAILMLHQVCPQPPRDFEPNRILRVTPTFLAQTIAQVREAGFDIVSMAELAGHLEAGRQSARPLITFTLDDGYKDNLLHAYPIFAEHKVPFTVYVPTDYVDGRGELWWLALEECLRRLDEVDVVIDGTARQFRLGDARQKGQAFHAIYWRLRGLDETVARQIVRDLCVRAGFDVNAQCRAMILDWAELRQLAADPLVTIGGHTRRHYALARLGAKAARTEIREGVERLQVELGRPIEHFSFPFGDEGSAGEREFAMIREFGFRTAVTTRKGLLSAGADRHALPRLSLNGDYQDPRYLKVLLSGVPFMLRDLARRIAPARAAS